MTDCRIPEQVSIMQALLQIVHMHIDVRNTLIAAWHPDCVVHRTQIQTVWGPRDQRTVVFLEPENDRVLAGW